MTIAAIQRLQFLIKSWMLQIMVEAFARSLIDKIILEAFDVVEPNKEKLRMLDNQQEPDGIESQPTRTSLQMHDRSPTDCNHLETMELLEKVVRGLHNLQIGDSIFQSTSLSALEKEVKHLVCSINSALPQTSDETEVTQGQGDVHQIIHDAVIEATPDSTRTRQEKETNGSNEATRISVNLLHRLIEELETKAEESIQKKENEPKSPSKEEIAVWEEAEEQFVRTIDSVDDPDQNNANLPSDSPSRSNAHEFKYENLTSSPVARPVPLPRNISLEVVAIEEIVPSPLPVNDNLSPEASSSKSQNRSRKNDLQLRNRKKRNVLGRMRKLLRTIFGRRKK
ncbi:uncharacterized protein LOC114883123 isoform X1 [Osmia bicornis bicornis]|uniref:uncharacterized protein LOC114883123 isoform X1 n=2 Tax=Osmia bicornis bicornis TaxID=1437191 RepID=UPI001EAF526F|nr:uncharacterized protein LOC114883123 isoform X1 [Osmia bicornis bicornis]XP_029056406.2 uncharacterized protein LOC114883123 isoform X1 [Osmia bicornis bicornis]XP_029056407.2 uncharacterized protein LOC114883123 isoform X1 [Osmia bicornis bicornis]XP_029056408.2 uncharacterized protein LOC114883123 isoform X1 [Osmia bicornis bicornis]XP_029056409.2 uncharacterized protein LOC114883123 isoform X1 [Osmia bicornis bicornis]